MPSQVLTSSSVNKTLFKNWQSRSLCCICWQKVNLGRKSVFMRPWTRWIWYGYSNWRCKIHHTLLALIPFCIAILLVDVPGFTSTRFNKRSSTSGANVFDLPGRSWCLKDPFSLRPWLMLVKVRLSGCLLLEKLLHTNALPRVHCRWLCHTRSEYVYSIMLYFSSMFTNPCDNHDSVGVHKTFIHNVHSNHV